MARVLLSARSWGDPAWASDPAAYGPSHNIARKPLVLSFSGTTAHFPDGSTERVHVVIYATGFQYVRP